MAHTIHKLLVYGTLRPNEGNTVTIPALLYNLGSFPGVRLDEEGTTTCEVLNVSTDRLRQLDRYEGFDPYRPPSENLYNRVPIEMNDGLYWIYEYNDFSNRPLKESMIIQSGDWFNR